MTAWPRFSTPRLAQAAGPEPIVSIPQPSGRERAPRRVQALITRREQDPVVLPAAAPQVLQWVPLSWNAAGGTLLPMLVPVKPMVTDADGAMVRL